MDKNLDRRETIGLERKVRTLAILIESHRILTILYRKVEVITIDLHK